MKKEIITGILALMIVFSACSTSAYVHIEARDRDTFDMYAVEGYFVNQQPDPAEPGRYVEVKWKIENTGTEMAENVIVELIPKFPFSLDPGESALRRIGSVWGRQIGDRGVVVSYRLRVDENAVMGDNEVELRYSFDEGKTWISPRRYLIRVGMHDAILNVNNVAYSPSPMPPGEKGVLNIELENFASSPIKDVRVKLELITVLQGAASVSYEELPFFPLDGSSQKAVRNIMPGEKKIVSFSLASGQDTSAGIYKVPLTIEYTDYLGNSYSRNEIISIIVGGEPVLELIAEPSKVCSGAVTIGINFMNKGTTDVRFLDVRLKESDGIKIVSSDNVYIGHVYSDDYEIADFRIFVESDEKRVPLTVEYSYMDANNRRYEEEKIIYLDVYDAKEAARYGIAGCRSGSGGTWTVVVIIALGLAVYYLWKRKKAKEKHHHH